jgi:hypothetical protein
MKNGEGNIKHAKLYLRFLSLVNGPLEARLRAYPCALVRRPAHFLLRFSRTDFVGPQLSDDTAPREPRNCAG